MSKVKLESIKALTFYNGDLTAARRSKPVPQLTCIGKPCKVFQPDVVRCTNIGGHGTNVDWKCDADLPEALRFGRVEVSCEGWSAPGDPYVLQNSCGLEYRLVEVPRVLRDHHSSNSPLGRKDTREIVSYLFVVVFLMLLVWILFGFCNPDTSRRNTRNPGGRGPRTSGSNSFPGGYGDDTNDPPPPYSTYNNRKSDNSSQGWRPGFWTGLVAGGLADRFVFNRRQDSSDPQRSQNRRMWDWERPASTSRQAETSQASARQQSSSYSWGGSSDNRGEGSSNLGSMRRSTGYGGSNVR